MSDACSFTRKPLFYTELCNRTTVVHSKFKNICKNFVDLRNSNLISSNKEVDKGGGT
jgi:hypothetical protein